MELKVEGNKVYKTKSEGRYKAFYSMYYKTVVSYKNGVVSAKYCDYLDNIQADYNEDIIFYMDGHTITKKAKKGIATISFNSNVPGIYTIKTINNNISNGRVDIEIE